ncbi:MAG: hypothetical protein R3A12_19995 [Ignavibacteria bacterium]
MNGITKKITRSPISDAVGIIVNILPIRVKKGGSEAGEVLIM